MTLLSLTGGCATAPSDACPALVVYDRTAMTRAADELAALPPDAQLRVMMADYATARDQIRACRGSR